MIPPCSPFWAAAHSVDPPSVVNEGTKTNTVKGFGLRVLFHGFRFTGLVWFYGFRFPFCLGSFRIFWLIINSLFVQNGQLIPWNYY